MPKYIVRVGSSVPDPAGKRDLKGRPVEVRFEEGDEISDQSVSPSALTVLLKSGAIEPITDPPAFTTTVYAPVATGANSNLDTSTPGLNTKAKK